MPEKLAVSPEDFRGLLDAAAELVTSYYRGLSETPVLVPTTSGQLREMLGGPLPREGADFDALLDTVRDVILRFSRHNGHPRFFGDVASPGTPVAAVGSLIEAALNSKAKTASRFFLS